VLQPLYGGALARLFVIPFQRARPHDVPADRLSSTKRLIVGGLSASTIGKDSATRA
jgi:hypothetical protein